MKNRIILDPPVPPRHCTIEQIRAAVKSVVDAKVKDQSLVFEPDHRYDLKHDDHYHGYVLGFLFSTDLTTVILVRKNAPVEQEGKLNGIGGKVIFGGSHRSAVWKNFLKVTGIDHYEWNYLKAVPEENGLYTHVFYGVGDYSHLKAGEEIWKVRVSRVLDIPWRPIKVSKEQVMRSILDFASTIKQKDLNGFEIGLCDGVDSLVEECLNNLHDQQPKIQ